VVEEALAVILGKVVVVQWEIYYVVVFGYQS
jgi:hypothetical protein